MPPKNSAPNSAFSTKQRQTKKSSPQPQRKETSKTIDSHPVAETGKRKQPQNIDDEDDNDVGSDDDDVIATRKRRKRKIAHGNDNRQVSASNDDQDVSGDDRGHDDSDNDTDAAEEVDEQYQDNDDEGDGVEISDEAGTDDGDDDDLKESAQGWMEQEQSSQFVPSIHLLKYRPKGFIKQWDAKMKETKTAKQAAVQDRIGKIRKEFIKYPQFLEKDANTCKINKRTVILDHCLAKFTNEVNDTTQMLENWDKEIDEQGEVPGWYQLMGQRVISDYGKSLTAYWIDARSPIKDDLASQLDVLVQRPAQLKIELEAFDDLRDGHQSTVTGFEDNQEDVLPPKSFAKPLQCVKQIRLSPPPKSARRPSTTPVRPATKH